jgi:hypothetical protein
MNNGKENKLRINVATKILKKKVNERKGYNINN